MNSSLKIKNIKFFLSKRLEFDSKFSFFHMNKDVYLFYIYIVISWDCTLLIMTLHEREHTSIILSIWKTQNYLLVCYDQNSGSILSLIF